jgi:hypothetical protein
MTTAYVTWSAVKRLMLQEGSQVEPECAEAVRAVIPDGSARQAEVGFPLAASLLDIYRYRYQSIEAFKVSRHGWPGFFLALETATGRVGLLAIRCSDWRFIVLTDENLHAALPACTGHHLPDRGGSQIRKPLPPPSTHRRGDDANLTSRQG